MIRFASLSAPISFGVVAFQPNGTGHGSTCLLFFFFPAAACPSCRAAARAQKNKFFGGYSGKDGGNVIHLSSQGVVDNILRLPPPQSASSWQGIFFLFLHTPLNDRPKRGCHSSLPRRYQITWQDGGRRGRRSPCSHHGHDTQLFYPTAILHSFAHP